jgi:hypothetical protein
MALLSPGPHPVYSRGWSVTLHGSHLLICPHVLRSQFMTSVELVLHVISPATFSRSTTISGSYPRSAGLIQDHCVCDLFTYPPLAITIVRRTTSTRSKSILSHFLATAIHRPLRSSSLASGSTPTEPTRPRGRPGRQAVGRQYLWPGRASQ